MMILIGFMALAIMAGLVGGGMMIAKESLNLFLCVVIAILLILIIIDITILIRIKNALLELNNYRGVGRVIVAQKFLADFHFKYKELGTNGKEEIEDQNEIRFIIYLLLWIGVWISGILVIPCAVFLAEPRSDEAFLFYGLFGDFIITFTYCMQLMIRKRRMLEYYRRAKGRY